MSVLNPQCSLEISVKFESRAIICKAVTETRAVSLAASKRNEGRFGISECHRNSYPAVDGSRRRPARLCLDQRKSGKKVTSDTLVFFVCL